MESMNTPEHFFTDHSDPDDPNIEWTSDSEPVMDADPDDAYAADD
jgi:hypothetical protein